MDNHIAELTVKETLDFAARVLGVGHKAGMHCSATVACIRDFALKLFTHSGALGLCLQLLISALFGRKAIPDVPTPGLRVFFIWWSYADLDLIPQGVS